MHRRTIFAAGGVLAAVATAAVLWAAQPAPAVSGVFANGSRIQHDRDVAVEQPGPHEGGGMTTGFPFFGEVADMPLYFRKRSMHPGSAIGYHRQEHDEVYYVLSGTGEYTLDGNTVVVGPGTALLTRKGSSHGLRQTGAQDLVIIVTYPREPAAR